MKNRHQWTPGEGGAPRVDGRAARTALPRLPDRAQTYGMPARGRAVQIGSIGKAGWQGHISL
jgi:hypothetical protein